MRTLIKTNTFQNLFYFGIFLISVVVGLVYLAYLLPVETYQNINSNSPLQSIALDITSLSLISGLLAWLLSIPLLLKISKQQTKGASQSKENKYLNYALNTHSLVYCVNKKGMITYANPPFCLTSGYEESELLDVNYRVINSKYKEASIVSDIWDSLAQVQTWKNEQGQTWQGEQYHTDGQGQVYWLDSTVVSMLDDAGEVEEYLVISRNITIAKKNEMKLLSLKRALDASNEMVIVTNEKNRIQYHNAAVNEISGWKKNDLHDKHLSVFNSPHCDVKALHKMTKCLLNGESWSGRLLNRRKGVIGPIAIAGQATPPDTRDYWVNMNITPIRDSDNIHMGYIQIQRDITTRIESELAQDMEKADTAARISIANILQQPLSIKERMEDVLAVLFNLEGFNLQRKGGIFLKNKDENCLDMYVLKGEFSDEFIRREQRIPMGACLCGRAAISQALIISDDCFCDPRHDHYFDGMKPHGHYIVPIISTAGKTLGILFLYTDPYPTANEARITKLKQVGEMLALALLQEEVKQSLELARDNAEEAAKTKTAFLANMSHEIRTPMNGVLGMLEMLKDTSMNDEQRDFVDIANNSAQSLLVIINDILDISKLEAGKVDLENIEFDLPALAEEVCTLMSKNAHKKGLAINCFVPLDAKRTWLGDPTRIRQILTNLVGNAIKFTEMGEVSIEVKEESIENYEQKTLLFKITDTGIGISPEKQLLLFQPFSQADSSTARQFGGTGLGLSISKELVNIMQGDIGIDSVPDQGSCFWFSLPLQPSEKEDMRLPNFDFTGRHALIVDGNKTSRETLAYYLKYWGVNTKTVADADEALVYLDRIDDKKEKVDIILSELNGLSFPKQMNNISIPCVLLHSGHIPDDQKLQELGFTQTLAKPIRHGHLFNALAVTFDYEVEKKNRLDEAYQILPDFSDKKILVVEDNKINQKVVMGMLKKFKVTPDIEDNGQNALGRLTQKDYDLVLMDCQMPVLDGYQATQQFRIEELKKGASRTTVVALTAHAAVDERDKCLAAGMDDYLTKPLSSTLLQQMLIKWLGDSVVVVEEEPDEIISTDTMEKKSCWDKSAALELLGNDQELLSDMSNLFVEDISTLLLELNDALEKNDLSLLADSAHTIKGIAGQLCAEQLTEVAENVESSAREKLSIDYSVLTKEMNRAATELTDELQQI